MIFDIKLSALFNDSRVLDLADKLGRGFNNIEMGGFETIETNTRFGLESPKMVLTFVFPE